jgi:O-antigen/teichoic acid export membrane protein
MEWSKGDAADVTPFDASRGPSDVDEREPIARSGAGADPLSVTVGSSGAAETRSGARSDFAAAAVGRFWTQLMTAAVGVALARYFTSELVGAWFVLLAAANIGQTVSSLGALPVAVRLLAQGVRRANVFVAALKLNALGTVGWLALLTLAVVLDIVDLRMAVAILVATAGIVVERFVAEFLRGIGSVPLASIAGGALGRTILLGVLLVGSASEIDVLWLASMLTITSLVGSCLLGIVAFRKTTSQEAHRPIEGAFKVRWIFLLSLVFAASSNGDILMANAVLEPIDVARYAIASRIVSLAGLPILAAMGSLPPQLGAAFARHDWDLFQTRLTRAARSSGLLFLPLTPFIAVATVFSERIFGSEYFGLGLSVSILVLGASLDIVIGPGGVALVALSEDFVAFAAGLVAFVVMLTTACSLGYLIGPTGVAIGVVSGILCRNSIQWWWLENRNGLRSDIFGRPE